MNGTLLQLKIEPAVTSNDRLNFQMKQQIIKMANVAIKNTDELNETLLWKENKGTKQPKMIKYCAVEGNGDCLFLSISHQLNGYKINSDQHKEHALKLRQDITWHIKENFGDFLHELKGRVYEQNLNDINVEDESEIEISCHQFIDTKLVNSGVWGGIETFKAISKMHNVNIIVLNGDGSCNMRLLDITTKLTQ